MMRFKKTLESLSKSLSKSAEITVKKSEHLFLISKISLEISSKEASIQDLYEAIGEYIYKKHLKGKFSDHDLEDYFKRINKLNKDIKELKKEISSIKKEKLCSNCNNEIYSDSKYCPVCGAKQGK